MCPLIEMAKSLVLNFEVNLDLCGAKRRVLTSISEVSARKLSDEDKVLRVLCKACLCNCV